MGVFAGPSNAWSNRTDANRLDASTKVVVQSGLVLNLDAGVSSSYPGSGTTWTDLSGLGNTGTLVNGPTYSSANGGSIVFDGSNDRITIVNPILSSTGNWTISTWFNLSTLNIDSNFYSQYIAETGNGRLILMLRNDGIVVNKFELFLGSGSGYSSQRIIGATTAQINTFYNLVAIRNGSVFSLYLNSFLETSTNLTGVNVSILQSSPEIGGINSGNFGFMNGKVYATSVYNRALSASEIQQNFNATRSRFSI